MAKAPSGKPRDPVLEAFGRHVAALRKKEGMTQEELAHASGIHWTYVSQIERGTRNVTLTTIRRLARGLGVEPAELVQ